jgi:signal transduction histidine kinase
MRDGTARRTIDRMTRVRAPIRFSAAEGDVYDWLLAAGLTLFVWVQITAPRLIGPGLRLPSFRGPGDVGRFGGPRVTPTLLAYVLIASCFMPLGQRRRYPYAVLGIVTAMAALWELVPHPPALTLVAVLIAVYTVGTIEKNRYKLAAAAILSCAALLLVSLPPYGSTFWLAEVARIVLMFAFAAAIGDAARNRRAYIEEVEQRAIEAEHSHEEEAMRRVDEERLRIARELHDITAHSLSIIAVQSGAALYVIDEKPAEARAALKAIRTTSKGALQELRTVLGVLRGEHEDEAPRTPSAGLAQLPELIFQVEKAGVEVAVDIEGDLTGMPAVVDASAYRVVQEALTNVLRHAGPACAVVSIRVEPHSMDVEVTDDGTGPPRDWKPGHGMVGMRERAAALGGTFESGPGPAIGFRVAASYPLPPSSGPVHGGTA